MTEAVLSCPHCRKPLRLSHLETLLRPNTIAARAVYLIQNAGPEGITRNAIMQDIYGKNESRWSKAAQQSLSCRLRHAKKVLRENGYELIDGRKGGVLKIQKIVTKKTKPKVKDSEGIAGAI